MKLHRRLEELFKIPLEEVQKYWAHDLELGAVDHLKISALLRFQVTKADRDSAINGTIIGHTIRCHEDPELEPSTKPPSPFKGQALNGFSKLHYYDGIHMSKNIENYWSPTKRRPDPLLHLAKKHYNEEDPHWRQRLANEFVDSALENRSRAGKLTGEWIVFRKHKNENYYLTLAIHSEKNEEISERLMELVRPEFPFLF